MLFWLADTFDKFLDTAIRITERLTVWVEWFSHSGDIRPSEPSAGSNNWLPGFEDDGAAYVEDPDFFYDEYSWEGNNQML